MKVAWRTTLWDIVSIVAATTREVARYKTLRSANDAGFHAAYNMVRSVRAPEHDAWAAVDATGRPWDEAYLPKPTERSGE